MNVYKNTLQEVQSEREKLYETAIQSRRTIETIARRVTALYFKLQCQKLSHDKLSSKSLPPQLMTDRKLTTVGGGEVSERNILNMMELIEKRSIQIVEAHLKQLSASQRSRRPSLILVSWMYTVCIIFISRKIFRTLIMLWSTPYFAPVTKYVWPSKFYAKRIIYWIEWRIRRIFRLVWWWRRLFWSPHVCPRHKEANEAC